MDILFIFALIFIIEQKVPSEDSGKFIGTILVATSLYGIVKAFAVGFMILTGIVSVEHWDTKHVHLLSGGFSLAFWLFIFVVEPIRRLREKYSKRDKK